MASDAAMNNIDSEYSSENYGGGSQLKSRIRSNSRRGKKANGKKRKFDEISNSITIG